MVPETVRPAFGAGRDAPYDAALREGGGRLRIVDGISGSEGHVELARFLTPADAVDTGVLGRASGTVLDVGCGPGRMVRAAIMAGHLSLGIDVSLAAVEHARAQGLPVLHCSVFDEIPREGEWDTVLLLDGNIGIGGDPAALLLRCRRILHPGGSLFVETHANPQRMNSFTATLVDDAGRSSEPFPWCEIGIDPLRARAERAGLAVRESWSHTGRSFTRLQHGDVRERSA